MNDPISRQAAIDAVYDEFKYVYCYNCENEGKEELCEGCHRKYMMWSASLATIERVLTALPSVQPKTKCIAEIKFSKEDLEEIFDKALIRCRDCKYWNTESRECSSPNYPDGYVTPAGFYCGWAERRQDERFNQPTGGD